VQVTTAKPEGSLLILISYPSQAPDGGYAGLPSGSIGAGATLLNATVADNAAAINVAFTAAAAVYAGGAVVVIAESGNCMVASQVTVPPNPTSRAARGEPAPSCLQGPLVSASCVRAEGEAATNTRLAASPQEATPVHHCHT
jgi:hypothetical protein